MSKTPDLREIFDPPEEVVEAGLNGELVLFIGAGASILLDLPSWSGLAGMALEDLRKHGYLNYSEITQLKTLDAKKQLSIAKLIAEDEGYDLDLTKHLLGKTEGDSIYKAINDIGCPCVTTNYDELIAPRHKVTEDGSTTAFQVSRGQTMASDCCIVKLYRKLSNLFP